MSKHISRLRRILVFAACALLLPLAALHAGEDRDATGRILAESSRGKAVGYLDELVNGIGARHAGSAADYAACDWAAEQFRKIGLENVHVEMCVFQPTYPPSDSNEVRDRPVRNVVADITGSEFPDQYVIIGAHLDSTGPGRGAEDNGAGVAAVIEAARLIMKSGVKPRRTIRFILFGGEEAMLLGSRSYIAAHPEILPKISAMLNLDGGGRNPVSGLKVARSMMDRFSALAGKIAAIEPRYGFTLQAVDSLSETARVACGSGGKMPANDAGAPARPMEALSPADSFAAITASGRGVPGGIAVQTRYCFGTSDHGAFLAAGIPAFMWVQEGPEPYHGHTPRDNFDVVIPDVVQHSAAVMAVSAVTIAALDRMLDRSEVGTVTDNLTGCGIGQSSHQRK